MDNLEQVQRRSTGRLAQREEAVGAALVQPGQEMALRDAAAAPAPAGR